MTTDEFIERLNSNAPPAMEILDGVIDSYDEDSMTATMRFTASEALCNPGGAIQGGFVCAMLDAAMAMAVLCMLREVVIVASLEIKISYLEVSRPGQLIAHGRVVRAGKTITFLDAELRNPGGQLLATATSTARPIRPK